MAPLHPVAGHLPDNFIVSVNISQYHLIKPNVHGIVHCYKLYARSIQMSWHQS